jgi:glycosyltransferase involved in cell wall biosynthesis
MIKLSAVVITYNEEKNIARCINSLKKVADDIIVVDSFSTDKTEEICLSLNVRFEKHKFDGHIEQKNYAVTRALFPFIISLDADEELSPLLIKSIIEVKNNKIADGYTMNRLTNYCGKWIRHGGWYPDKKLRLWDSTKGSWQGVNPHDCYKMQANSVIKHLKGDILHYSYYSIEQHLNQVNNFTNITSKQYFIKGKKSSLFKIFAAPVFKFFRDFVVRTGFLDGYYGYVIAKISAHAVFIKYAKIRELNKTKKYNEKKS